MSQNWEIGFILGLSQFTIPQTNKEHFDEFTDESLLSIWFTLKTVKDYSPFQQQKFQHDFFLLHFFFFN